ncbi:hypothetical protein TNCV_351061 [Trichonephila clavipes]|nr:hypothetical protein TNCV_351061 [Trichonephila clavipes]
MDAPSIRINTAFIDLCMMELLFGLSESGPLKMSWGFTGRSRDRLNTHPSFNIVDDDNVRTTKEILEFVQNSKNVIDADSDDENEMNTAAPVPTSSEMKYHEKYA